MFRVNISRKAPVRGKREKVLWKITGLMIPTVVSRLEKVFNQMYLWPVG